MSRHGRPRGVALAVVFAFVLTVVASGCGGTDAATTEPTATTKTSTSTVARTTTPPFTTISPPNGDESSPADQESRCKAATMRGAVRPQNSGAGTRSAVLVVTNTGVDACTLWGYGGIELVAGTGNPVPTDAERNLGPAPSLVTLAPSATARKNLRWGVVAADAEPVDGPCQPASSALRVIPPDETEPFTVDFDFGSVCGGGHIETSAYYPG